MLSTFEDRPFGVPLPTDAELIAAYAELKSVWKVGERFTVAGQWVHQRLQKAGVKTSVSPEFTENQKRRISDYYANTPAEIFCLDMLASELHKSKSSIARYARKQGFSNKRRKLSASTRQKLRGPRWQHRPHPRGMTGKKHTAEALGGYRADLNGIYFRSSWEANYARYLNLLIKFGVVEKWEFEPETFWFDGVSRGANSYKPDFRIKYKNDLVPEYVEIKGWIVPKDRTKWRRMKKYHPHIKLVVIAAKEYYALQKKWASAIPTWETKARLAA